MQTRKSQTICTESPHQIVADLLLPKTLNKHSLLSLVRKQVTHKQHPLSQAFTCRGPSPLLPVIYTIFAASRLPFATAAAGGLYI
jgi:hypothetical protein